MTALLPAVTSAYPVAGSSVRVVVDGPGPPELTTRHFRVWWGELTLVAHDLPPGRIDNGLARLISDELGATRLADTPQRLGELITALVAATGDPATAWRGFYDRTLAGLLEPGSADPFAAIYRRAGALVRGRRLLDVASCLGFWPLLMSSPGYAVTALDADPSAMRLLGAIGASRGASVRTVVGDATHLPLADCSIDTTVSMHLLEHLDPAAGRRALRELIRVARRRVIVAVPFEAVPTAAFGHVRTFDLATLAQLGTGHPDVTGWSVQEHHGGWLVLDLADG